VSNRLDKNKVAVAYREPFAFGSTPYRDLRVGGETIAEIVRSVPRLPDMFESRGVVCINGEEVPREMWSRVRPKVSTGELPIAVTLHWPLGNLGGSNSGKSIIALVAAIALIAVATAITGGAAAVFTGFGEAGLFAAGSTSATLLASAVSVAGALAISALTAPPTQDIASGAGESSADNRESASAQANLINPGGAIPRVIGTRKIYPPFVTEPLVELVDDDEYVEALMALNGPHQLEDLRVDGVSITDAEDVEFETREGWESDMPVTLVTRQGKTSAPQITMSQPTLKSDNISLAHPSLPETDLSVWHGVAARNSPDEIWFHFLLPGGLAIAGNSRWRIPLRIRMRLRGSSTWINLPEIHYANDTIRQLRFAVLFKWQDAADPLETVPANNGFVYAFFDPIDQTVDPPTPSDRSWTADSYFDRGGGHHYFNNGNEDTSRIININLFDNRAEIYLSEASFPKGIYEFEVKRGVSFQDSAFNETNYTYAAQQVDFFWYQNVSSPQVTNQTNVSDRLSFIRVISVWNDYPVKKSGFALMALRAVNRNIQRISTEASGYVKDWDGSGWNTWTTTSNPAPHYVDVLSGAQNLDPLPSDLRDDTGILAWRTLCTDNEWTCDTIVDDMRTQDVLATLAACAYAKPYQSDQYGVTVDNDRSEDVPVQVFSRINTSNMHFDRAFVRPPEGFVVTYRDNLSDDDRAQTFVYQRDPSIATTGLLESIAYEGLVDLAKVRARAQFDLDQANLRSTFYTFDTDIESIVCRRGSLVGLQHDILTSRSGDARIKTVTKGNSPLQITGLILDSTIPVTNEPDMHSVTDLHSVADMHLVGVTTGIAIRRNDGTLSTHLLSNSTGETNTVTLAVPFSDPGTIVGFSDTNYEYGCMITAGDLHSEYRRMLVFSVTPQADLKASVTLVDEAPSLLRYGSNPLFTMGELSALYAMDGTSRLSTVG